MSSTDPDKLPQLPDVPPGQVTPAILTLIEVFRRQQEQIQVLRDEIARLKGR